MDNRHLYRGKQLDTGEWVYGYYLGPVGICDCHEISDINDCTGSRVDIDPSTLGRCTGLSAQKSYRGDRPEDLLIWEGDVCQFILSDGGIRNFTIKHKSAVRRVVSHPEFDDSTPIVEINGIVFEWNGFDLFPCINNDVADYSKMKIIGTIHEGESK